MGIGDLSASEMNQGQIVSTPNRVVNWLYLAKGLRTRNAWRPYKLRAGSNLYRLGVPDMVIQRILRHANVSTTATYYIKSAAGDVRNAMAMLEDHLAQAARGNTETVTTTVPEPFRSPDSIQ
jgi:integrase